MPASACELEVLELIADVCMQVIINLAGKAMQEIIYLQARVKLSHPRGELGFTTVSYFLSRGVAQRCLFIVHRQCILLHFLVK